MPQRKIPVRDLIQFVVQVRKLSCAEGDERRNMVMIRNLANRMYRNHIGYNYRGEYRLKAPDEEIHASSVLRRRDYLSRMVTMAVPARPLRITSLGHSGFWLRGPSSVVIDPFLRGQSRAPLLPEVFRDVEWVLLTHDLPRHLADAQEICRRTRARLVLAPGQHPADPGPEVPFVVLDEETILEAGATTIRAPAAAGGGAVGPGVVVTIDGFSFYHAGRPARPSDLPAPGAGVPGHDVVFLPIGGGPALDALEAARVVEALRPQFVIPMQYGTYRAIEQNPEDFMYYVGERSTVRVLRPGESWSLDPRVVTEDTKEAGLLGPLEGQEDPHGKTGE